MSKCLGGGDVLFDATIRGTFDANKFLGIVTILWTEIEEINIIIMVDLLKGIVHMV